MVTMVCQCISYKTTQATNAGASFQLMPTQFEVHMHKLTINLQFVSTYIHHQLHAGLLVGTGLATRTNLFHFATALEQLINVTL